MAGGTAGSIPTLDQVVASLGSLSNGYSMVGTLNQPVMDTLGTCPAATQDNGGSTGNQIKSIFPGNIDGGAQAQPIYTAPTGYTMIVVSNAGGLVGNDVYGSGTCVDLAKEFGSGNTGDWAPGPKPDANTPPGTLVATFEANNGTVFANQSGLSHVGSLLNINNQGITLVDQFAKYSDIQQSFYAFGGTKNYNADANNYRIVLVKTK
jgi:hypothetical protein